VSLWLRAIDLQAIYSSKDTAEVCLSVALSQDSRLRTAVPVSVAQRTDVVCSFVCLVSVLLFRVSDVGLVGWLVDLFVCFFLGPP
jgi:hypothetical protein